MADSGKKQIPLRLSGKLYDAIAAWAEDDFRSVKWSNRISFDGVCTTEKEKWSTSTT